MSKQTAVDYITQGLENLKYMKNFIKWIKALRLYFVISSCGLLN